jgi:threonyl-tRNA synthetase
MTEPMGSEERRPVRRLLERRGPTAPDVVAARLDGRIVDLMTLVPAEAAPEPVAKTDPAALDVLRHTAAHVMADAVQQLFPGTKVTIGPAIEEGFYYDFDRPDGMFTEADLPRIEERMREIAAADRALERIETTRDEAAETFRKLDEPYKLEILEGIAPDATITLYRHGDWLDLCAGPHVPSTGAIGAFRLTGVAGAYWRGDERNKMLSRVYGTAFPSQEALDAHLARLEEAKKRDHRRLGKDLDLFSIHEDIGGGLVLWHPKGGYVRTRIEDFWRKAHLAHGYEILYTPHIGRAGLWERSGHLGFYAENMYSPMDIDGNPYLLKPMNCPFHIAVFNARVRSYRDLPLRWAELGTVYRYERSGQLHGLARVRGFTQDDAHLFLRRDQVRDEILRLIDFSTAIFGAFGFQDYRFVLATRPEKSTGDPERWADAERYLREAVEQTGLPFDVEPGGGAFYGPKIDLHVRDAIGRSWQCSTIQVDFIQPENFDLTYAAADGTLPRPVMLHRTLLGSIERFFGILVEHVGGAFPVWLAPVHAAVLTVSERQAAWAREIDALARKRGLRLDVNDGSDKLGAKIRDARNRRVPYLAVVGDREVESRGVSLRSRAEGELGAVPIDAFLDRLAAEAEFPPLRLRYD